VWVTLRAHRYAFELVHGPVPAGHTLDHRCHTDDLACAGGRRCRHRRCVRPDHLEPVTGADNLRRRHARHRAQQAATTPATVPDPSRNGPAAPTTEAADCRPDGPARVVETARTGRHTFAGTATGGTCPSRLPVLRAPSVSERARPNRLPEGNLQGCARRSGGSSRTVA
jgi:hypothetical protein